MKDDRSFAADNKQIVLIPRSQKFGPHSKGEIRKLVGADQYDHALKEFALTRQEISYLHFSVPIKQSARAYYRQWASSNVVDRTNPNPLIGEVCVSRVGWRHITRAGRRRERILQSLQLLAIAKRIVKTVDKIGWIGRLREEVLPNGNVLREDLIGIRAIAEFPHRDKSVVQVILRRTRVYDIAQRTIQKRIWFYSVYEIRRGYSSLRGPRTK